MARCDEFVPVLGHGGKAGPPGMPSVYGVRAPQVHCGTWTLGVIDTAVLDAAARMVAPLSALTAVAVAQIAVRSRQDPFRRVRRAVEVRQLLVESGADPRL